MLIIKLAKELMVFRLYPVKDHAAGIILLEKYRDALEVLLELIKSWTNYIKNG